MSLPHHFVAITDPPPSHWEVRQVQEAKKLAMCVRAVAVPQVFQYASPFAVEQTAWSLFRDVMDAGSVFCIDAGTELSYYLIKFCLDAGHKVVVPTYHEKRVEELGPKGDLRVSFKKTFCCFREIGGNCG